MAQAQLTLHVNIRIPPASVPAFLSAFRPVYDACTSEPECLFFHVSQSSDDHTAEFHFVEVWRGTRKWFEEVQLNKKYYVPYLEKTQPMWTQERDMVYTERVEGFGYVTEEFLQNAARVEK